MLSSAAASQLSNSAAQPRLRGWPTLSPFHQASKLKSAMVARGSGSAAVTAPDAAQSAERAQLLYELVQDLGAQCEQCAYRMLYETR